MSERKTVLIVEDEARIADLVSAYLERAGYRTVRHATGVGLPDIVRRERPDLVLLDLGLPGQDGLAAFQEVRAVRDVPIIIVTARIDEIDRLLGLELGADDYICKPFSPRELVARVRNVLRRTAGPAPGRHETVTVGPVLVDPEQRTATVNGVVLDLTRYEFDLLRAMASRPGRVFTRAQLLFELTGNDLKAYERTIDSHIKNLRRKLREAAG
ncbi:MAG: response regulator, partial [Candidatus Dadabacteria bacterium]